MPVSSLIVRTDQKKTQQVVSVLKTLPFAQVSNIDGENIVVITDTQAQLQDRLLWDNIGKIPGVLQCDLIYHNFEDEEEIQ